MTKDEALKLALDYIVATNQSSQFWLVPESNLNKTVTAIKEALANEALEKMAENARELGLDYEPAQEPVGEIVDAIEGAFKCSFTKMLPVGTKLYTTPPQRKPLTDEEIWEALGGIDCTRPMLIARAIEAKLRSKNV